MKSETESIRRAVATRSSKRYSPELQQRRIMDYIEQRVEEILPKVGDRKLNA